MQDPQKKLFQDLMQLQKFDIVHYSIQLKAKTDEQGNYVHKKEFPDRFDKVPIGIPKYKNIKLTTKRSRNANSCIVPMGEVYNLIGIDVDNKDDTLERYQELCEKHNFDRKTFTMKTMHDGVHEYYALADEQKLVLKGFNSMDGRIFGLNIDVKYNNQILFGPGYIVADKTYTYEIAYNTKPVVLPNFIFLEILRNLNKNTSNKSIAKTKNDSVDNKITNKKVINNKVTEKNSIDDKVIEDKAIGKTVDPDYIFVDDTTADTETENSEKVVRHQIIRDNDPRLKKYLDCLNIERFTDYSEWIKVGFIIFNECGTCSLWNEYSQKAPNYDNTCCNDKWKTFDAKSDVKVTIRVLIEMAKDDNYQSYKKALLTDRVGIIDTILFEGISDLTASQLFYCLHPEKYIYDVKNADWYEFNEYGIYIADKNCIFLKSQINETLLRAIEEEVNIRLGAMKVAIDKKRLTKRYMQIKKILSCSSKKDGIIKELSLLYKQIDVYSRLNSVNNYIFAFKNGVYDLKTNTFRKGYAEELVTCTCGYDYKNPDNKIIEELTGVLKTIMPDPQELKYLLKSIAFGLIGVNQLEEFYIWIGSGANGKGLLGTLIDKTLGDYFGSMDIEYLCQSKRSGNGKEADPVMASKKDSRMVITTEPESEANIKCGKLKEITGGDKIEVRELYKSPFKFIPKFKLIIQTNQEPKVDGSDGGTMRRLRFMKFPNKFVDNPTQPNERKIDRTLKEKISNQEYSLAFFQILANHYNDFVTNDKNELIMPPRFKKDTENYIYGNDPIKQFINDKLEKTANKKDTVGAQELYDIFTGVDDANGNISMTKFKSVMIANGINQKKTNVGNVYFCIKVKNKKKDGQFMFIDDIDEAAISEESNKNELDN